ncbi:nitrogen permease reactivator protein [Colletotrichum tofieldiae]|nr:nitrogen permease reactivator protein [Colletotrichum tofieldiae]GKT79977.1 nitrogen permease reactivator protein [Colletotrichum tofieldiae]
MATPSPTRDPRKEESQVPGTTALSFRLFRRNPALGSSVAHVTVKHSHPMSRAHAHAPQAYTCILILAANADLVLTAALVAMPRNPSQRAG